MRKFLGFFFFFQSDLVAGFGGVDGSGKFKGQLQRNLSFREIVVAIGHGQMRVADDAEII
jgi:hypothetical protein